MKRRTFGLIGAIAIIATLPAAVSAQVRVAVDARIGGTRIAVGPGAVYFHARDTGPRFCRDGRGHPVHGWRWCARRGWERHHRPIYRRPDPRHTPRRYRDRWVHVSWVNLRFQPYRGRHDGHLNERQVFDVLGPNGFRHVRHHADRLGLHGGIDAVWYGKRRGVIGLDVRVRGISIARLEDRNRDGWIDAARVRAVRQ